jgi:hypothetical protein
MSKEEIDNNIIESEKLLKNNEFEKSIEYYSKSKMNENESIFYLKNFINLKNIQYLIPETNGNKEFLNEKDYKNLIKSLDGKYFDIKIEDS